MKTKADPSGQARNRNKGTRRLHTRLSSAERSVKALFRSLPRSSRRQARIVNTEQTTIYDYEYDQADFAVSATFIINDQLLETQTGLMPFDWYWKKDVELPYRQGTAEEVRDFNQMIAAAVIAGTLINGIPPQTVPIESVLLTEPYRKALGNTQVSNFNNIKTLSERTAAQVLQRINSGIRSGQSPTLIANDISARFDVAKSSAQRISETEINAAYNNAKLDATRLLGASSGLRSAVIHISALTPTTRANHAARHGNAYTVEDQLSWWDSGTERIQCKCSVRSVLIDRSGNVVQSELQDEIKAERSFFDD